MGLEIVPQVILSALFFGLVGVVVAELIYLGEGGIIKVTLVTALMCAVLAGFIRYPAMIS